MPCFRPLTAYWSRVVNPATGKRSLVWSRRESFPDDDPRFEQLAIPCGQCRFCRLEHSRQWALRCVHEASQYSENCFLTLTYRPECLPKGGSIVPDHAVSFMKRLRARFGEGIRSYGCGEYGEELDRPHYHLCIFNFDFPDKKLFKRGQHPLYRSDILDELWGHGHCSIGELTFESAAYVARYVTKKIRGPSAPAFYQSVDASSGEVFERLPERALCVSRRPGIGRGFYEKFGSYIHHHDFLIRAGRKMRSTKYYDRLFDIADPQAFAKVKAARKKKGETSSAVLQEEDAAAFRNWDLSKAQCMPDARLTVIEQVLELKFKLLKRGFEDG